MRLLPVGESALLLEVADERAVAGWHAELVRRRAAGEFTATELVPAARTVLIDGVPSPSALADQLRDWPPPANSSRDAGPLVEVPTTYDGPDLADVAALWDVTADEVIARHTGTEFQVAFCGFAPGFGYLTGLPEAYAVPRRDRPRPRIPAGSVGLAGPYTGVYPSESPGGWQLIGRTDLVLFDPDRDPPALLAPGTRVRFVERSVASSVPSAGPMAAPGAAGAERYLEVVRAGPLCTVQDLGRVGLAHLGVPRSGAADAPALRTANRLVGNPDRYAGLELTVAGARLRPSTGVTIAVTGAPARLTVDGAECPVGQPVAVPAGGLIGIGPARGGVRGYLAVAGGIAVPPVLGSRSTDTLSGLGPPVVRDGDHLPLGEMVAAGGPDGDGGAGNVPTEKSTVELRVTLGPRVDWFSPSAVETLLEAEYVVSPTSNRIGARLTGPALARAVDDELPSEGVVAGAVQVPASGEPLIFLADHPTTGGYPVIAVVEAADLPWVAQARPGTTIRFRR